MRALSILILFLIVSNAVISQAPVIINAYAQVTAISGKTISVSNVDETYHTFEDGNYVIIMQMQDNIIGTNTTNAVSFGNIAPSIQSVGLYEVALISSHSESSGLPNSIVLNSPLSNTYNINSNASVQLITFRDLGTNFTTTASIGALAWNGAIGGIIAASAGSVFTLAHNISADASGFRGGGKNTSNGSGACDYATYITTVTTLYAAKGEGNYKATNSSFLRARGKILTGGGAGNTQNSGGGGGGNYSRGGTGGIGSNGTAIGCTVNAGSGGVGAEAMTSYISGSRIFMGGGGGGGHENNSGGTVGGAGGGIIILKANTLSTAGSCSGLSISANGGTAANATSDGAGGGGAGGTVFLQVNTFSIASSCQLVVSAAGGNGGSCLDVIPDGGGGGGGEGVIIYGPAIPSNTNITNKTDVGAGGSSCYTCTSSQNANDGFNFPGSVKASASGPLPVELVNFSGEPDAYENVHLNWRTAKEINNRRFIVQRLNGDNISTIAVVTAKGNYSGYEWIDKQPGKGSFYYRLIQEDDDGTSTTTSHWIEISIEKENDIKIYPNPLGSKEGLIVEVENKGPASVRAEIINVEGVTLYAGEHTLRDNKCELDLNTLPAGAYILKLSVNNHNYFRKLIKD
jgi:hypothetical protein